jgi:hypothetical protein
MLLDHKYNWYSLPDEAVQVVDVFNGEITFPWEGESNWKSL